MKNEGIIPDLWVTLESILEAKDSIVESKLVNHVKTNLKYTIHNKPYGLTMLQRLFSHPLFNKEQSDSRLRNTKYKILTWAAEEYHPNLFETPELFYQLYKNEDFLSLFIVLSHHTSYTEYKSYTEYSSDFLPVNSDEKESRQKLNSVILGYDSLIEMKAQPYQLVVYGYLLLEKIMHLAPNQNQRGAKHANPVLALKYFVEATVLGIDCWKEIEWILTSEIAFSNSFYSPLVFFNKAKKVMTHWVDDRNDYYYHQQGKYSSAQACYEQCKDEALHKIFNRLKALLTSSDHASAFYLNALVLSTQFEEYSSTTNILILQSNLYLKAAALGHSLAIKAFENNWSTLLKIELTNLDIPALIPFLRLIAAAGNYIFPAIGISVFINFCDSLYNKLSSVVEISQNHSIQFQQSLNTFSKSVLRSDQINEKLDIERYEQLISIISLTPKSSNSLTLPKLKALLIQKYSILNKELNALQISLSRTATTQTGSLDDNNISLDEKINGTHEESKSTEEQQLQSIEKELKKTRSLLKLTLFDKFATEDEKSTTSVRLISNLPRSQSLPNDLSSSLHRFNFNSSSSSSTSSTFSTNSYT